MIAIQSESGELVKILDNVKEGEFGLHRFFGLISKDFAEKRANARKRKYYDYTNNEWLCSFKIQKDDKGLKIFSLNGCEVSRSNTDWKLKTSVGVFNVSEIFEGQISPLLESQIDKYNWLNNFLTTIFLLVFLFMPLAYYLTHQKQDIELKEEEKIPDPIDIKIPKEIRSVKIEQNLFPSNPIATSKQDFTRRAVQRNLGFLGMVGHQDLNKVVGGIPQQLKQATIGAGAGGDAGSGGEVLTGLGKGLKKTTVGNSGVQGLGGIGTKGKGGGLGGYGNTLVASGEGKGISAIPVSNSDMVLEGGISRYAINATIAKYLNQVRRCYEAELRTRPELQGLVEMNFEINANGKLNFSKVSKSTLQNPAVESCISEKMMDWQFPKPKGAVNVNVKYPFMLRPVGN